MSTILGPQLSFQWRQGTVSQKQKLIAPLTIWPMKHIFGLWKKPQNPHRHNMPTPQRMDPLGLEPGTFSCCETIVLSTTVLSMTQASQTKSKFSNFYTYCNASHLHKRCRFRLMSVFSSAAAKWDTTLCSRTTIHSTETNTRPPSALTHHCSQSQTLPPAPSLSSRPAPSQPSALDTVPTLDRGPRVSAAALR